MSKARFSFLSLLLTVYSCCCCCCCFVMSSVLADDNNKHNNYNDKHNNYNDKHNNYNDKHNNKHSSNKEHEVVNLIPLGKDGIMYQVRYKGWGAYYPLDDAPVLIQYEVLQHNDADDDTINDQQYQQYDGPVQDAPLDALQWALRQMVEGDEWELRIPSSSLQLQALIRIKFLKLSETTTRKVYSLTCNLRTKKDCAARELTYSTNIAKGMRNHPNAMRKEIIRLDRHFREGRIVTPEDHAWQERRIFLLKQLVVLEEERIATGTQHRLEF